MKDYKIIPPKQRYMSLAEIEKYFSARGVVAYGCTVSDGAPRGGHVIAVQNEPGADSAGIKAFMRQIKAKFPGKEPIYYIRLEPGDTDKQWAITYDNGGKQGKTHPEITVQKSPSQEAIEKIPLELIAKAIKTGMSLENDNISR